MSGGPLATMTPRSDATARAGQGSAQAAPGWGELFGAGARTTYDEQDLPQIDRLASEYNRLADNLVAAGVPRAQLMRRSAAPAQVAAAGMGTAPQTVSGIDRDAVWSAIATARSRNPKAFADLGADRASFDREVLRRRGGRDADQATLARGTGIAGTVAPFVGGMGASFADPFNIITLPLGGGGRTIAGKVLSEAAVNMGVQAFQLPWQDRAKARLGEDFTAGQMAESVLLAGAGAGALRLGGALIGKGAAKAWDAMPLDMRLAMALKADLPPEVRSPDLQAALNVVERSAEVDASSPYVGTYAGLDRHVAQLETAMHTLEALPVAEPSRFVAGPPTPAGRAPVRASGGGSFDREAALSFILKLEGGPELVTDSGGLTKYGISQNANPGVDIANLTEAQAREIYRSKYLAPLNLKGQSAEAALVAADASVNHGPGFAQQILKATGGDPAGMIALRRAEYARLVRENPAKYARYANGWENRLQQIEERIGLRPGEAGTSPVGALDLPEAEPLIRPDALDTVRPLVDAAGARPEIVPLRPSEIQVDAPLMQFKSEGDAFGVTERLRGVTRWDPMSAGTVTVWERADGARFIADGHQRLGLAKRIMAQDPAQDIQLNAFVLREADGVSARDARIMTAHKNLREGSGKAVDAAKVFREAGADEDLIASMPSKGREGSVIRDGRALADLSQEAFGAVVNEVIPERYGAVIGRLARDFPDQHMALVDLLAQLEPANRHQAESIVRQALEAGFSKESQVELFGSREVTSALFLQRAKVLDRTLAELRKLKGAFGVAARNAEALDAAGNTIDVRASEAAASDNARALALVDQLALRRGNAVNAIVTQAAERLANGEPLARVVKDVVAQLRDVDLARAISDADANGRPAGDGGYQRDAGGEDGRAPDPDAPATLDELEAAGQGGFALFDAPAHQAFDDPAGAGVQAAADSIWHDIKAAQDGAPADIGASLEQAIAADPAAARAQYEALPDSEGGRIINTDLARELSPEYRADRSRSAEVHEPASAFVKQLYAAKLREPVPAGMKREVLFTGGGTGAGKSTGLALLGAEASRAGIVYDTNMNTLSSAISKIDQALNEDWDVSIVYTWRDPIEALVKGALPRAERMGRTVPLETHIETHVGAREAIDALQQHYAENERVTIRVIDNSHGKDNARVVDLENLPRIDDVGLYDKALAETVAAYDRGDIGRSTFRGSVGERAESLRPGTEPRSGRAGPGDRSQPQPQHGGARALDPAELVDLEDGRGPRSIADIEAELKRGEDDLAAIEACL